MSTESDDLPGACADCLNLAQCRPGTAATVTCVLRIDANARAIRRLAELGLRRGASVTAGQRTPGGGRVIGVADAWLALDAATVRSMHVTGPA